MSNIYKQTIEARVTQSLCMTQELQQSIKLLQLSSIELNQFVTEQLEVNPLLELEESSIDQDPKKDEISGENDYITSEIYENTWSGSDKNIKSNFINNNESFKLENYSNSNQSLKEYVVEQILLTVKCEDKKNIALYLCDLIDDSGYLRENLSEISLQIKYSLKKIEETLFELQKLDPPGIFARDLSECLTLQLQNQNCYDDNYAKILSNLDLLTTSDKNSILKKYKITEEKLKEILAKIRTLNPKPGSNYTSEKSNFIIPDVYIRKNKSGEYIAELNHKILPKIMVNHQYYENIKPRINNLEDQKYLSNKFGSANWLLKALNQRADTILKVSNVIATKQQKFLDHGIKYLNPLTLKDIAIELDIHESTVSRVTSNKYINTPRGNFEMKYFFSSGLAQANQEQNSSSTSVKYLIKDIISSENENILSDDEITKMLKNLNIDIARRTVAKYRDSLNIPTSSIRKRDKKLYNFA